MEGYVYILTNPSIPLLLKIGSTKRSPEERKRELSRATGIPTEFVIAYEVFTSHMEILEQFVHNELDRYRVNRNREFFKVDLSKAILLLRNKVEAIRLEHNNRQTGINEVLDVYEAIEILGNIRLIYEGMIRSEIVSVRLYQTSLRCYLEITEEEIYTPDDPISLRDQKIQRIDLGFISNSEAIDEMIPMFNPNIPVSENARFFIEEFDDYSKLNCCSELFTEDGMKKIDTEYHRRKG